MISALSGFAVIGVIVLVGWIVGRSDVLPAETQAVGGRLAFVVLTPCLIFSGAAASDPGALLSRPLIVSTAAALLCFGLHALTTRGRDTGTRIVGALAAGYTNATYIGVPVATYVLRDTALVVPIVLLQLLIITPVALTVLQFVTTGHASWRTSLTAPFRVPLTVAVALGVLVAVTGIELPSVLAEPITAIGQAAVPVVLLVFGMSLSGRRVLEAGPDRRPIVAAVVLKTVIMPALAFLLALALRLPPAQAYAVTIMAALPTAQNIFLYAQSFGTAQILARDAIFLSTLACVPALLIITLLHTLT
ncbi:AEC family transporter [Actinoplanes sp. TRM 88003]|uniref:AEC family transporter n=1 Tax=Paractinoplanes aksuensis TaxID=2939490 RepID=A0ABT1DLA5_9ACTN|nr:AEC family transporter [Actinoplanes aksuensis]MCO8270536.1 AEC family transporter [Actinoplanes aksuensis]